MAGISKSYRYTADGTEFRRDLGQSGDAAERFERRTRQAFGQVSPAIRALDAAAGDLKQGIAQTAAGAGTFGAALSALGPIGIAAAAGVAAVGVGLAQLNAASRSATDFMNELYAAAQRVNASVEFLQEWRFAAVQLGYDARIVDSSLQRFAIKLGQATSGLSAEATRAFTALGFSEAEVKGLRTVEEALPRIAERWSQVGTAAQRAAIAERLGIVELVPVLNQGADALKGLQSQAAATNNVLDEETVRRGYNLAGAWDAAAASLDVQLKQAALDAAPAFIALTNAFAAAARGLNDFIDVFQRFEERSTRSIESQLSDLRSQSLQLIERYGLDATSLGAPRGGPLDRTALFGLLRTPRDRMIDLENQIGELEGELARRQAARALPRTNEGAGLDLSPPGAPDPRLAAADRVIERLRTEAAEREALIRLQRENKAATDEEIKARRELEQAIAALNDARALGVIQSDQELETLTALARANFDAAQAERRRAADLALVAPLIGEAATATQTWADQVAALDRALAAGDLTIDQWTRGVKAARQELDAVANAGTEALLGDVTALRRGVETPAERFRRERAELDALVAASRSKLGSAGITDAEAARALEDLTRQYEALEAAELRASAAGETLAGVLSGQITSLEQIGDILRRIASEALLEELFSAAPGQGGGFGGFLGRVGGRITERLGIPSFGRRPDEDVSALGKAAADSAKGLAEAFAPSIVESVGKIALSTTASQAETSAKALSTTALNAMAASARDAAIALRAVAASGDGGGKAGDAGAALLSLFSKGGGRAGGGGFDALRFIEVGESGKEIVATGAGGYVFANDDLAGLRALMRAGRRLGEAAPPAAGAVTVNVKNETGDPVEAQARARRGDDGGVEIDLMLRRHTAASIGSGEFDPSMRQRYGLTRQRTVR